MKNMLKNLWQCVSNYWRTMPNYEEKLIKLILNLANCIGQNMAKVMFFVAICKSINKDFAIEYPFMAEIGNGCYQCWTFSVTFWTKLVALPFSDEKVTEFASEAYGAFLNLFNNFISWVGMLNF